MRLDKFIGHASDLSRAKIHSLIKQGAVCINALPARKAAQHISPQDTVTLDGKIILPAVTRYLMLHKPKGYVSARSDSDYPTVLDLIDEPHKHSLQIVGRLDLDTSGLLLLTDDGQWNHRVTSPKSGCTKVYRVTTAEAICSTASDSFLAGILLHGEKKPTQPAQLHLLNSHIAVLTIEEGKYHQVKRMFAALGNRVVELHRESVGAILLDPALSPGQYRALTEAEIASI